MSHKLLMAVGGTGGHLFPAIALSEELTQKHGCSVLFAGGKLSKNPLLTDYKCDFRDVSCGKLSTNPFEFLRQSFFLVRGVKQSIDLLRSFNPDAVIGFGSYHSLPLLIASKMLGKKIYLHEGNSIPGKVNRWFAPFASKVWIQFPSAQDFLNVPATLGGLPLRKNLKKGIIDPQSARKAFQLDPDLLTLMVIGGSQGAKKLNALFSEAVLFHLRDLLPAFQVIHGTGSHEEAELMMARYVSVSVPAYVRPFINKMECCWSAANLAITRAGASSLTEQFEFEVPGVVIPYPFAADNHQDKNADFLASSGLIIKLNENELTPQGLAMKIQELFIHTGNYLSKFEEFKKQHPLPPLADAIIQELKCN